MSAYPLLSKLFKELKIGPGFVVVPLVLAMGAALLEGVSTGLLIPLLRGLVASDFSFLWQSTFGQWCLSIFPGLLRLNSLEIFTFLLSIVFLASLLRITLSYLSDQASAVRMQKLAHLMRSHLFSNCVGFGKLFFDQNKQGELHNIIIGFTQHVCLRLQRGLVQIRWLMLLAVYLVLMVAISWRLTLLILLMLPLYHYPISWVVRKIGNTSEDYAAADSLISGALYNALSCIGLVKLSAMEDGERNRFSQKSGLAADLGYAIDKKVFLIAPIHETLSLFIIMVLTVFIALMVMNDRGGDVSAYLIYLYVLKRAATAFGTLADLRGMLASMQGQLTGISKLLDQTDKSIVPDGLHIFEGLQNAIEIRNLSFSYLPEKQVLKDLNLTISKGQITALVGPSGSGKTTISNLLLRLYDCPPGTIFYDQVDIREIRIASLLKKTACVSQETQLLNDTFKNNLCYGLKTIPTEDQLQAALSTARLQNVVTALPEGLATIIGDRGVQLSGGEKQRLAIARAVLRDPEILFLDEATSSLDAQTEQLIQEALDELIAGKTVLVIAHRFSTLRNADRILTIENGAVVESGSFEELASADGTFSKLLQAQKLFY